MATTTSTSTTTTTSRQHNDTSHPAVSAQVTINRIHYPALSYTIDNGFRWDNRTDKYTKQDATTVNVKVSPDTFTDILHHNSNNLSTLNVQRYPGDKTGTVALTIHYNDPADPAVLTIETTFDLPPDLICDNCHTAHYYDTVVSWEKREEYYSNAIPVPTNNHNHICQECYDAYVATLTDDDATPDNPA